MGPPTRPRPTACCHRRPFPDLEVGDGARQFAQGDALERPSLTLMGVRIRRALIRRGVTKYGSARYI